MRIAVFSAKGYDRESLTAANEQLSTPHELAFIEARLTPVTAPIAHGNDAVCAFVNDDLSAQTLGVLALRGRGAHGGPDAGGRTSPAPCLQPGA